MISVIQRVTKARVTVGGEEGGRIGPGLVALLGVAKGDGEKQAAEPETARRLYEKFIENVKIRGIPTQSGKFGAYMKVELINDGPVTIIV